MHAESPENNSKDACKDVEASTKLCCGGGDRMRALAAVQLTCWMKQKAVQCAHSAVDRRFPGVARSATHRQLLFPLHVRPKARSHMCAHPLNYSTGQQANLSLRSARTDQAPRQAWHPSAVSHVPVFSSPAECHCAGSRSTPSLPRSRCWAAAAASKEAQPVMQG